MSEALKIKRTVQLKDARLKESDFVRIWWVATVEHGVTREDILRPDFWAQTALKLKPYNRIDVQADDGSFFAEYLVLTCDKTYATLKELSWTELNTAKEAPNEEFYPKWGGPHLKWRIIRSSDNEAVMEMLDSKDLAIAEIPKLMKMVNT